MALAHAGYAAAVGEALAPLVEHVSVVAHHSPSCAVPPDGGTDAEVPVLGIVIEVHDGPEPAPGCDHPPAWLRLCWDELAGWRYVFPHEVGQFAPEDGHPLMDAKVPEPRDLAGWLAVVIRPHSAEWYDAETEPAEDMPLTAELAELVDEGALTAYLAAQLAVYAAN
ncbi:hypothetical protein [Streptodolium elevatio]|uniref:Uncharacterized protein n=1 Tax=Streptodolium elevatio TaxID=3157996 RepID=A0ABV3DJP6_9ACTN